jgi:hypothetical protein
MIVVVPAGCRLYFHCTDLDSQIVLCFRHSHALTMAINKGLLFATVLLLVVSMEVGKVQAGCDTNGIISKLSVCIGSAQSGNPDQTCCGAMQSVQSTYNPDPSCICTIAQAVAQIISKSSMKDVVEKCIGAYAVPACLTS